MTTFSVRGWSAWAPGIQSSDDWLRWAESPVAPSLEGTPELKFIPAMVRRRFSRLSKLALQVAFDATPPELVADVSTVFASRHGESKACVGLLSDIAQRAPLSPTAFSHSVHNTQAGLYSIAAQNGRISSSIAAGRDTFCAGLIETLGICERAPARPTLLVIADELPPEIFAEFQDEIPCVYALALLIEPGSVSGAQAFRIENSAAKLAVAERTPRLPQALEFLAWMLGDARTLELPYEKRCWRFERELAD